MARTQPAPNAATINDAREPGASNRAAVDCSVPAPGESMAPFATCATQMPPALAGVVMYRRDGPSP